MSIKRAPAKTKEGLPEEAFAIVSDPEDPETWKLSHHTKAIFKALAGKLNIERTVDWEQLSVAVVALSPRNRRGQRLDAYPEEILEAARHLAEHYRMADRPLPDTLAALV